MSLRDQIAADVGFGGVFFNASDFGELIQYTPAGGAPKTIVGVIEDDEGQEFLTGGAELQYERRVIQISAGDNTAGHVAPKFLGKVGGGGGDRVVLPDDVRSWYVAKKLPSDRAVHRLVLVDNQLAIQ